MRFFTDTKIMPVKNLIIEFDNEYRILHLSAAHPIHIETKEELTKTCHAVGSQLEKYVASERCFMVVDLSAMIIEPKLVDCYSRKVQNLCESYLYPGGLLRYGFQITRVTAKLGYEKGKLKDLLMFSNKQEAYNYIYDLIKSQKVKA